MSECPWELSYFANVELSLLPFMLLKSCFIFLMITSLGNFRSHHNFIGALWPVVVWCVSCGVILTRCFLVAGLNEGNTTEPSNATAPGEEEEESDRMSTNGSQAPGPAPSISSSISDSNKDSVAASSTASLTTGQSPSVCTETGISSSGDSVATVAAVPPPAQEVVVPDAVAPAEEGPPAPAAPAPPAPAQVKPEEALCNGHESQDSALNSPSPGSGGTGDSGRGRTLIGDTKSEASEGTSPPEPTAPAPLESCSHSTLRKAQCHAVFKRH